MSDSTTQNSSGRHDPFKGLRVIDFTSMMAGPYSTRFLADGGADVIKVEAPEGDYIRTRDPMRGRSSAYFGHLNAGKRSIVLDMKNPDAVAQIKRLIDEADVLVEAFRPGVMKRLGFDFETLRESNPGLIYCAVSGFGQTGPGSDRPAYAQIVHAASGYDLAFANYQDDMKRPPNSALFLADVVAGISAYAGIVTALYDRERTKRGQMVDVALMDGMLCLMPYEFQEAQFPAAERRPVYAPLKTQDGYIMISAVSPRNWENLFEVIGRPDWRDDPMLATNAGRQGNFVKVMALIEAWMVQRTSAECVRIFDAAGVPATPYKTVRESIQDPQFAHRGSFSTIADEAGEYLVPNLPFRMSEAQVDARRHVPLLGEHTEEILRDVAGASPEAIAKATARASKK
ncbi:MAG: CaiB/BaiF CoA transferase family protein [Janthinobacterium lividum]